MKLCHAILEGTQLVLSKKKLADTVPHLSWELENIVIQWDFDGHVSDSA